MQDSTQSLWGILLLRVSRTEAGLDRRGDLCRRKVEARRAADSTATPSRFIMLAPHIHSSTEAMGISNERQPIRASWMREWMINLATMRDGARVGSCEVVPTRLS
ncbi:hypothetical protein N658DRAFT_66412 [Parathielavia hyrcaniae]|uniref:Uncharacterized protein n=1 Tax=Parathielavia hyrcaniae TaxID=113614 RepID=A0AAN6Q049_9PEZI|nr:hypothetical protein N658DRAFT_66412 [Parathielavia hyrcaniae]